MGCGGNQPTKTTAVFAPFPLLSEKTFLISKTTFFYFRIKKKTNEAGLVMNAH